MINFLFALWIAVMPIIFSFSDLIGFSKVIFGYSLNIPLQLFIISILYIIYSIFRFAIKFNYKNLLSQLKVRLKKPITYLFSFFVLSILISLCINGVNSFTIIYLSYFIVFCIVFKLNKSQIFKFVDVMIVVTAITCIMGFIDPTGAFMPGFYGDMAFPLSNQYLNPNYAGYIVTMCMAIVVLKLKDAKSWQNYIKNGLIFTIYSIYLYMNGSFVPITAVFMILVVLMIYFWIKEKKFPIKIFIMIICFAIYAFVVDSMPNVNNYRTCGYNYFLECIAVFDNIFGTNILNYFNIDSIAGADGWNRNELIADAVTSITTGNVSNNTNLSINPIISFLFGFGAGGFNSILPHNNILHVWMDFGFFSTLLYICILVSYFIKFFKSEKNTLQVLLTSVVFIMTVMGFFGTIMVYWYWMYISFLGAGFKSFSKEVF